MPKKVLGGFTFRQREIEELEAIRDAEEDALIKAMKEIEELDGAVGELGVTADPSPQVKKQTSTEGERKETGIRATMVGGVLTAALKTI